MKKALIATGLLLVTGLSSMAQEGHKWQSGRYTIVEQQSASFGKSGYSYKVEIQENGHTLWERSSESKLSGWKLLKPTNTGNEAVLLLPALKLVDGMDPDQLVLVRIENGVVQESTATIEKTGEGRSLKEIKLEPDTQEVRAAFLKAAKEAAPDIKDLPGELLENQPKSNPPEPKTPTKRPTSIQW